MKNRVGRKRPGEILASDRVRFSSAMAGVMISISSRPSAPDSPACGFSPATAIRGFSDAVDGGNHAAASRRARSRPYSRLAALPERNVGRDERDCSFPPVSNMAKFSTPQRRGKKFGLPRKLEPDFVHARLVDRPGHHGLDLAGNAPARFFEGLQRRLRGLRCSGVGLPNEQSTDSPITRYSAFGRRPEASAARTISGPMPAGSPRVMPMRLQHRALSSRSPSQATSAARQASALTAKTSGCKPSGAGPRASVPAAAAILPGSTSFRSRRGLRERLASSPPCLSSTFKM